MLQQGFFLSRKYAICVVIQLVLGLCVLMLMKMLIVSMLFLISTFIV
jgi:hypothetical protein